MQVPPVMFVFPPILVLCLFFVCLWFWDAMREKQVKAFAASQGIAYLGKERDAPIVVPQVVYERYGRINRTSCFLYGTRHGVEVFACRFHVGSRRGNATTLSMVGVRAELLDLNALDLKRWKPTPLNGWTFLIPREPKGGTLSNRKIAGLWDALTAAAGSGNAKAV